MNLWIDGWVDKKYQTSHGIYVSLEPMLCFLPVFLTLLQLWLCKVDPKAEGRF